MSKRNGALCAAGKSDFICAGQFDRPAVRSAVSPDRLGELCIGANLHHAVCHHCKPGDEAADWENPRGGIPESSGIVLRHSADRRRE